MIPGVVASQGVGYEPPTTIRPVRVSGANGSSNGGAFAIPLPVGSSAGQLAILAIAASGTASISLAGWTAIGTVLIGTGVRLHLFWRVLTGSDSGTISANGRQSAACTTFLAGTFDASGIALLSEAVGSSNAPAVPLSIVDYAEGQHFNMQFAATNGGGIVPITYPFGVGNTFNGIGTSPLTFIAVSGGDFDGGLAPATQFGVASSVQWASRKIAIKGATA